MQTQEEKFKRRLTADHAVDMKLEQGVEEEEFVDSSGHFGEFDADDFVMDAEYVDDDSSLSDSLSSESDNENEKRGALRKGKKLLGKSAKLAKKTVVGTGKLTAKTAVGKSHLYLHFPAFHLFITNLFFISDRNN
jgi:hypothetical protein